MNQTTLPTKLPYDMVAMTREPRLRRLGQAASGSWRVGEAALRARRRAGHPPILDLHSPDLGTKSIVKKVATLLVNKRSGHLQLQFTFLLPFGFDHV